MRSPLRYPYWLKAEWINRGSPRLSLHPSLAMTSDQLPFYIYPPDTDCFYPNGDGWYDAFKENHCSVTSNMVNFLNLTENPAWYLDAYCLRPPANDDCPFGFCPNPDIAGPLVRVASELTLSATLSCVAYSLPDYITGFCLGKPSPSPDTLSKANANLPSSPSDPHFL